MVKFTPKQLAKAKALAEKLKRHKDKIKNPHALARWIVGKDKLFDPDPGVSKKDFEGIADSLKTASDLDHAKNLIADYFQRENPRFDRKRFLTAAGKLSPVLDPKHNPKPIDISYYGGMVRLVPSVDQLIEAQLSLPGRQWHQVCEVVKDFRDVERIGNWRIVRRGRKNAATNLFIDRV